MSMVSLYHLQHYEDKAKQFSIVELLSFLNHTTIECLLVARVNH